MIRAFTILLALIASSIVTAAPVPEVASAVVAPVDPARLAIAQRIGRKTMPDGSYAKIFTGMGDQVSKTVADQSLNVSLRDFAEAMKLTPAETASLGPGTFREIIAVFDPAFAERQRITTKVIFDGIAAVMTPLEPVMREGMAQAYARRFDVAELLEIEAFFATPTGTRFAAEALLLASDPAVVESTKAMAPALTKSLPALMVKANEATAGLPKPRRAEDLTIAECREVARLIGMDAGDRCDHTTPNPKT